MNSHKTALHNCTIYTGTEILRNHAILVDGSVITGLVKSSSIPDGYEHRDMAGLNVSPSLIDLQVYGGNGKLFSHELSIESLHATHEYCLGGGAAHFMITMATNTIEKFIQGIDIVDEYWRSGGKGLLGLHLEGPYLNPIKKGAHLENCLKRPTLDEVQMLLQRRKGVVKMITIAPEICDDAVIRYLLESGLIVSAGHSNASYQEGLAAFAKGIPAATHLFNAMSAFQSREPGMVGAIYDDLNVISSVVCDGVHVDFAAVRISKRIMGPRLFFITDAVAETTSGEYQHLFKGDRYTLPGGTLSGSCLTMMQCVRNGVQRVGMELEEALRMGSLYPASLLKDGPKLGKIDQGFNASFMIFDDDLNIRELAIF